MSRCRCFCHFTKYNVATKDSVTRFSTPFYLVKNSTFSRPGPGGGRLCWGHEEREESRVHGESGEYFTVCVGQEVMRSGRMLRGPSLKDSEMDVRRGEKRTVFLILNTLQFYKCKENYVEESKIWNVGTRTLERENIVLHRNANTQSRHVGHKRPFRNT